MNRHAKGGQAGSRVVSRQDGPTRRLNAARTPTRSAGQTFARALLPLGAMLTGQVLAQQAGGGPADATLPAVTLPAVTLPEVQVRERAEREREQRGYQGGTTSIGRTQQLTRDIPQSVTIVPGQLMFDRSADTFREALRVVPGLTFNAGEGGRIGDNITLRGFSVVGDLYMDNLRDAAQYNRDLFNVEQVDVLRGSASMLFGRGTAGGVINQVSKQPFLHDESRATATYGSHDFRRVTVDHNQKLGRDAALRITAMKADADSSRDGVHTSRMGFAPSFRWGIGTRDEFMVSIYHLEYKDVPDYGVPYFNGRPLAVPVSRYYGLANADYQRDTANIATVSWNHRFAGDAALKTVLRVGDFKRDLWATAPRLAAGTTVVTDATAVTRQAQRRGAQDESATLQSDYTDKLSLLGLRHELLAGMELTSEKSNRWNWGGGGTSPATTVGNTNPYAALPAGYWDSVSKTGIVSFNGGTTGLYAQDTIELAPRWKLLLGARHDYFRSKYDQAAPTADTARIDRVWSTRGGLIWQPDDVQSYYASYGTSFNPSAELYSIAGNAENTDPERNRNMELGGKWELADGNLSLRTALFRTEKTNERNTDLSVNVAVLSGRRHTDGVEFEAAGRITRDWEVFAGMAFMRASIDEAVGTALGTLGKRPINTPSRTGNVWSTYKLGCGWKAGAGVEWVGDRFGDQNNANMVPGYSRVDAMLARERTSYTVKLNVLNLMDRDYYEGVYSGHVVPGTRRTLQATVELKF